MPEGPEVRREAVSLSEILTGNKVENVFFGLKHLDYYRERLVNETVEKVDSRGKAILIFFSNNSILYSHNQLYGKWFIKPLDSYPKTNRTLRVLIQTKYHNALLYSASDIEVLDENSLVTHKYLSKLGPDIFEKNIKWQDIASRFSNDRFASRKLGSIFLDQKFVAGLGNYLRSEILFDSGLHPDITPKQLSKKQITLVSKSILSISHRSFETGGVTNKASLVKTIKKSGLSKKNYRFAVFSRKNQPCYRCKNPIQRIEFSGRRLYMCSSCQTK